MKKFLHITISLLFISSITLAQGEMPNKDFEKWVQNPTYGYWNPVNWSSPNEYLTIVGDYVVTYDTSAYSGDTCVKMETKSVMIYTAPGAVTLGKLKIDMANQTGTIIGGIPFTDRPSKLKGYYKSMPKEFDSAMVMIYLTKYDQELLKPDTIGLGTFYSSEEVDEWTEFTIDLMYLSDSTPDTINVFALSSDFANSIAGSKLYVDDFKLEFPSGIEYDLMPEIAVKVYPNPARDYITFEIPERLENGNLIIFDVNGRQIKSVDFTSMNKIINIGDFDSGMYYFYLLEGKDRMSSGSFMVE